MKKYDFIIIGSGTSGGVWAYYLTKAGFSCLMLEAGKEFTAETFPDNEMDYNSQLIWNGGMDVNTDASLAFLRGKCVGGGSIINQCLLDRFDDIAFNDWSKDSGIDFNLEEMIKHYEAIEGLISLEKVPKDVWNRNAQLYVEGFEKLGLQWAPLRRGQTDCANDRGNDCIICLGGCPRDSKQSIPIVFLPEAKKNGLELWTEFLVDKIIDGGESIKVLGNQLGESKEVECTRCVVASGALGTTQILLKSGLKNDLPALGENFRCHPQIMNFAYFDEEINAHKGAFQAIKSADVRMREKGYKLENVFASPIGIAMLYPKFGKKHQEWMRKYNHLMCMEIAVRDVGKGRLSLDKKGRLKIHKKLSKEDNLRAEEGKKMVKAIFEAVGAKEVYQSPLSFGLHLMGGCVMGNDPKTSVVNENFQVHRHPNIFISDSSIFPNAPGINPALTIMALTEKASNIVINQFKK
ncbi:MAG: GMC family oxidoreductase N-terminal domain-containing protein [Candidatus Thorarchaeota archaeon]